MITGASGGIGAETARGLSAKVPDLSRLILCARNVEKAEEVAASVKSSNSSLTTHVLPLELKSLEATRSCAEQIEAILDGDSLDLLVNNAGVMACPLGYTSDGIEEQYGVNHLGAAALTLSLLPALRRTGAEGTEDSDSVAESGRVIFVSSMAVALARGLQAPPTVLRRTRSEMEKSGVTRNAKADAGDWGAKEYEKWRAYGESKLAMSMFAKGLARAEEKAGHKVTSVSLHPGVVMTELGRHITPAAVTNALSSNEVVKQLSTKFFSLFGLLTPVQGAQMSLELSGASPKQLSNGTFYTSLGFRTPQEAVAPLLFDERKCAEVLHDTAAFLDQEQLVVPQ